MMMIDKLAYSSPLRYKSAFLKTALAVGTLTICVAARSWFLACIILVVMGCLTVKYSRASFSHYFKMMAAPFVFLLLGTIAIVVDFADMPMGIRSVPVGNGYLVILPAALRHAGNLILISLASVSCLYFLILTTTVQDLLVVMKKLHVPQIFLELMLLIYRFIFVLLDMALAITLAQKCRLGYRSVGSGIRCMGQMLAALLIRSIRKSSAVYDAMEARGYDGQIYVLEEMHKAEPAEVGFVMFFLILLLAAAVLLRVFM